MSAREAFCPMCEERAIDWSFVAPTGYYRCYNCLYATPYHDLPTRSILRFSGPPPSAPPEPPTALIEIRLAGSATDTASATTVTVPNVQAEAGDLIVCMCMHDGFTEQGSEYLRFNITWGGITGVGGGASEWAARELHTTFNTQSTITIDTPTLLLSSGGTNDLVVEWSAVNPIPVNKVVIAAVITGLSGSDFWYFLNQTNTEGNDSDPIGPSTLMRRADSIILASVGTRGPQSDSAGSWTGDFQSLARVGTESGTEDRTLDFGYKINFAIDTHTAGKTGITARPWLVVPTIFDRP